MHDSRILSHLLIIGYKQNPIITKRVISSIQLFGILAAYRYYWYSMLAIRSELLHRAPPINDFSHLKCRVFITFALIMMKLNDALSYRGI